MKPELLLKWLLITVLGAALLCSVLAVAIYLVETPAAPIPQILAGIVSPGKKQPRPGLPMHLTIPSIGVDAPVERVGLTPQGAMGVPKGPDDVAWYELGPRPGEEGRAVIAGHVGWKNNIEAVFDHVSSLRKGDKIYVEDGAGMTVTFVVSELRMYDQSQNAETVFNSSDGQAHLALIACEGVWDERTKDYSKRLVIFADKELQR